MVLTKTKIRSRTNRQLQSKQRRSAWRTRCTKTTWFIKSCSSEPTDMSRLRSTRLLRMISGKWISMVRSTQLQFTTSGLARVFWGWTMRITWWQANSSQRLGKSIHRTKTRTVSKSSPSFDPTRTRSEATISTNRLSSRRCSKPKSSWTKPSAIAAPGRKSPVCTSSVAFSTSRCTISMTHSPISIELLMRRRTLQPIFSWQEAAHTPAWASWPRLWKTSP